MVVDPAKEQGYIQPCYACEPYYQSVAVDSTIKCTRIADRSRHQLVRTRSVYGVEDEDRTADRWKGVVLG